MGFFANLFRNLFNPAKPGPSTKATQPSAAASADSPEFAMLRDEAKRLSRQGQILREDGAGEPDAYWHDNEPGELCISLKHNDAWLNVYLDDDEDDAGVPGGRVEIADEPTPSDCPLYATPYTFLPHIDTVFRLGSDKVQAYLHRNGWERNDPYNDNFPDPAASLYEQFWMQNCPLYLGDIAAAVGGWNMPWPEDEPDGLVMDDDMVLWTFEDAEPWIEVFARNGAYVVKQRIT